MILLILLYGLFVLFYMASTSPNAIYSLSCISRGAAYFFLGYAANYFIIRKQARLHTAPYKYLIGLIFIICVTGQAILQKYYTTLSERALPYALGYGITEILAPIAALCLLYGFREGLSKQKFLRFIGNLSFEIYCFHVIILNVLWKITDTFGISSTPVTAGIIFLLTCILSIATAYVLKRITPLHKLLFPRGIKR